MQFPIFTLEERLREHYDDSEFVLCLSGVKDYSMGELRKIAEISQEELDSIVLLDSPREGDPELRRAIAKRWGIDDPDRVLPSHGSTEAMFLAMNAVLQPDDEVIVPTPCYQPLASIPEALGCRIVSWPLLAEEDFAPRIERIKKLLTPRTKMVIANFPHNPTGANLTPKQQQQLIEVVADAGIYLLWDAAFIDLCYDSPSLPDPSSFYERTISLGTLSKSYGMGGLRLGWCVADPATLKTCIEMRGYLTVNLSPLIERIACRIINKLDRVVDDRLNLARDNLDLLTRWMDSHREAVEWVAPRGGVTAFPRLATVQDIDSFCQDLCREEGVLLLPGSCFGFPRHVRLGFGGPGDELAEGLARLSRALARHPARPRSGARSHSAHEAQSNSAEHQVPTGPALADKARLSALKIRKATEDDAEQVAAVMNHVIAAGRYTIFDRPFSVAEERDFIASMSPRSALFVAETKERIVGVQSLDIYSDFAASVQHVATMGTWLHRDFRGYRLGRRLAQASFDFARANDYRKIIIQVLADNDRALRFYRGLGFRDIGTAQGHVHLGGRFRDEVFLEKPL